MTTIAPAAPRLSTSSIPPPPSTPESTAALLLKFKARIEPTGAVKKPPLRKPPCWLFFWCRVLSLHVALRHFKPNDKVIGQEKAVLHRLESYGLSSRQIDHLWTIFLRMDFGNTGVVTLSDFKRYFLFYRRHALFADYVFDLMDRDADELLNFGEFALGMQRFCSFDYNALVKLAFHLIDANHSHRIERDDLTAYLNVLYANHAMDPEDVKAARLKNILEKFGKSENDVMGISMVQQVLRSRSLGDQVWEKMSAQLVTVGGQLPEQHVYQSLDRMKIRKVGQLPTN